MVNTAAKRPSAIGWLVRDLLIFAVLASLLNAAGQWLPAALNHIVVFVIAYVLCYITHEWGHWVGGRMRAADQPFLAYKQPLMTRFDIAAHTSRQFLSMSWGGVLGYLLAGLSMLVLYFANLAPGGLAVGALAFMSQSLAVDLPQIVAVSRGADPLQTNQSGAATSVILRRTWQTWLPLSALLIAWHFWS